MQQQRAAPNSIANGQQNPPYGQGYIDSGDGRPAMVFGGGQPGFQSPFQQNSSQASQPETNKLMCPLLQWLVSKDTIKVLSKLLKWLHSRLIWRILKLLNLSLTKLRSFHSYRTIFRHLRQQRSQLLKSLPSNFKTTIRCLS